MAKAKIDGRSKNGGHSTGGRKPFDDRKDRKIQTMIFLSENEFNKSNWKSIVCEQFKEKFENKLKINCESK